MLKKTIVLIVFATRQQSHVTPEYTPSERWGAGTSGVAINVFISCFLRLLYCREESFPDVSFPVRPVSPTC